MQSRIKSQEALLFDYLRKLRAHRSGRRAIHLHLSDLAPQNRTDHNLRGIAALFDNLVKTMSGQIFTLTSGDIVLIFKTPALEEVEAVTVKLCFQFATDPLLLDEQAGRARKFVTRYDFGDDYDELLVFAQSLVQKREDHSIEDKKQMEGGDQRRLAANEPLTPQILARIEDALVRADLSNLLRRQAVSAIVGKASPQVMFHELFISIADLRQTLIPNVNLASDPWLFQHLTETLDRRVLALLNRRDDRTLSGDVSINLNITTLLSTEFLTFDDKIRGATCNSIVLELQKVDIFTDLGAYLFARDFAHERGYRICIDGMSHRHLPFIHRDRLGADLVKLVWNDGMPAEAAADGTIADAIRRTGDNRIILCRCDTPEAIQFGQSMNIAMFQGRHVEQMISEENRRLPIMAPRRR